MTIEAGAGPAAGAVAPATFTSIGAGEGPVPGGRPISDIGMPADVGAAPEKMVPLFGNEHEVEEPAQTPAEGQEEAAESAEQQAESEQQPDGQLTPEALQAAFNQWKETGEVPEALADLPIWVPDGKDGKVPIRLSDIHNNVMLYNDYQRKTTEVAYEKRRVAAQEKQLMRGRDNWVADMNSGDPDAGLRAMRAVGAGKTLDAIVVRYVQKMAKLEGLDPQLRQEFLEAEAIRDRNFYLERQLQWKQEDDAQQAQEQAQQQGANAPDVKFVMDSIEKAIPELYKELRITDSPLIDHFLQLTLAEAATGKRDERGQWIEAPIIQLGRAPSRDVLKRLVLAAKEKADATTLRKPAPAKVPPTTPIKGSGPAAKPGQPGNIGAPPQMRFSDLATGGVKR